MSLGIEDLSNEYAVGTRIGYRVGARRTRTGVVLGYCYTIPEDAGSRRCAALVVQTVYGIGHVLPSEIVETWRSR